MVEVPVVVPISIDSIRARRKEKYQPQETEASLVLEVDAADSVGRVSLENLPMVVTAILGHRR
jgi:hypothetical protein